MFLFTTLWACSLIRACSFPRQGFTTPKRLHIVHRREPEPLFTGVRGIRILGSSAHSWYSEVFCAMAHIHSPQAGVCCARCVASAVPREGAGQLCAFLLLEAGTL